MAELEYKGGLFSPSTVRSEMNTVDAQVTALVRATNESGEIVEEGTRVGFQDFVKNWLIFKDENDDWVSLALNSTRLRVAEYRNSLIQWQTILEKQGIEKSVPPLTKVTQFGSRVPWRIVAAVAGVGVLAWGLSRLGGGGRRW